MLDTSLQGKPMATSHAQLTGSKSLYFFSFHSRKLIGVSARDIVLRITTVVYSVLCKSDCPKFQFPKLLRKPLKWWCQGNSISRWCQGAGFFPGWGPLVAPR